MADALDLLEIGRNQQHREPIAQRQLKQMVDVRLRPDIDADGRLLKNEQPDMRLHPASDHDLLLISAGKRRRRLLDARRLDGKALRRRVGIAQLACAGDEFEHTFAARRRVHVDVLAHGHIRGYALFGAAARHEADAVRHGFRRTPRRDRLAVEQQPAGGDPSLAENRAPDRVMACAAQADQTKGLARGDGKRDRPHVFGRKILEPRARSARPAERALRMRHSSSDRRSSAPGPLRSSPARGASRAGVRREEP